MWKNDLWYCERDNATIVQSTKMKIKENEGKIYRKSLTSVDIRSPTHFILFGNIEIQWLVIVLG